MGKCFSNKFFVKIIFVFLSIQLTFYSWSQPVRLGSQISLGITTDGCSIDCVPDVCSPAGSGNHAQVSIFYNISVPAGQYISLTANTVSCSPNGPGLDGSDNFFVNGISQGPFSNDQILNYSECFHNPCPTPTDITIELSVNRRDEAVELDWTFSSNDPGGGCVALGTLITPVFDPHPDICEGGVIDLPPTSNNGINGSWSPMPDNSQTTVYTFTPSTSDCVEQVDMTVTVLPLSDASFDYDDFCTPVSGGPTNITTPGGTFSFNPDPGNGSTIDPVTGVISNALQGVYEVRYETTGQCPGMQTVSVTATAPEDASFNFDDYCEGDTNGPDNIVTPGGTFEFDPAPGDGATIDSGTGEISNGVGGTTYIVRYTTSGSCPGTTTQTVTVNTTPTPSFDFDDFCVGGSNGPTNISPPGGTFSFANPPGDGATIDPNTGVISNATDNTYEVLYTTSGTCPGSAQVSVTAQEGPAGTLSGNATLCPGQCETFSFSFTSGSEPYTLNLTASPPGIALPAIPGVSASQEFTICYGGSGLFPSFDPSTFTINIPTIFSGSGSLLLTGISDGSGCPGTASGSFSLTLTSAPTANSAGPLTACADIDGNGTFDLTTLDNTVTGGNGSLTVEWFEDMDATQPIGTPSAYISMGGTVYVRVNNGSCPSATIPVDLIVETSDIPFISMLCAASGTDNCTLCLTNNQIELEFLFGDNNTYVVTVRDDNTGLEYSGQVSNITPLIVSTNSSTTFTLLSIQPLAGCPNFETYSDIVTIDIVLAPQLDPIVIDPSCLPVILPPISGSHLSGNESYYTGPNGTGTPLIPGTEIFSTQTLYIYDINGGCEDEVIIEIIITPVILFDDIMDMDDCVEIVLPSITGNGVSGNSFFSTMPDGTGDIYDPGDIINFNTTLFVTDPDADPNCLGNSVSFDIIIYGHPDAPNYTVDCMGSTATLTVTNLPVTDHSVSLGGGPFQTNPVFTNVPNGTYTLVIRNDVTGCESDSVTVNINCGCDMPAILNLPRLQDSICFDRADILFTLENITFESPTQSVTVTTNGAGTIFGTPFSNSPFTVSYAPNPADSGRNIDIIFTTNDPDGSGPCTATIRIFRLTVLPRPSGFITGPSEVCPGQDLVLTATGGRNYMWEDGSSENPKTFSNILADTAITVIVTDTFGCQDTVTKMINLRTISAGRDTSARFCVSPSLNIDLNSYLSASATRGGIWKFDNDTIKNPGQYSIAALGPGDYLFQYIISDTLCGPDTSDLELKIVTGNNAGQDDNLTLCQNEGTIALASSLGFHDTGGFWRILTTNAPIVDNQGNITLTNALPGVYTYQYIIPENGCEPDTATLVVDIKEFRDIGPFSAITRCIGSIVDLRDIIRESVLSGTILNPNNHSGLNGAMWNTTGLPPGTYTFEYLITNETPCPNDIELLTIVLQENLNAGDDNTVWVCSGQEILLQTLLSSDADTGGRFVYQGQEIPGGIFTPSAGTALYTIEYQVGDGVTCPIQSAVITLNVESAPSLHFLPGMDICENDCQEMTITTSSPLGTVIHLRIQNSDGTFTERNIEEITTPGTPLSLTFCNEPGLQSFSNVPNQNTIILSVDSLITPLGCIYTYEDNIIFNTLPLNQKIMEPILCSNEEFILEGQMFNFNNPSGNVLVPATNTLSCDTLVSVNLLFYPEATGNFENTFCHQDESVMIGTEVFDFNRPSGSVILPNASSNGCDSTVNVNLTYELTVIPGTFLYSTCDIEYKYTVGNDTFSYERPSGTVLLSGLASGGCDSLISVLLQFTKFDVDYEIEPSCEEATGQVILTNSNENGPYQIFNNGTELARTQSFPFSVPLIPDEYSLIVSNTDGCFDTLEFTLATIPPPDVLISQMPLQNGNIQITTTSGPDDIRDLSWSPAEGLSCVNCPNPTANPVETTTYTLSYTYGNDCRSTQQITIQRQTGEVVFPNIIRLNSGINHSFYVLIPDDVTGTIPLLRIYDRWGNKVFEKKNVRPNNPDDGWTGQFNGRPVQSGVYMYYVEILWDGQSAPVFYAGDVTVTD